MYYLIFIIATILLVPGILMAISPFPGILYMFAIALGTAFIDNFVHLSRLDIEVLAGLALVVMIVDFFSGMVGAKMSGAHWSSMIWGTVGLIAGSFLIPVPIIGSIVGMFLGVLASELHRTHDMRQANKAAMGTFWGWVAGTSFKLGAAVVFLILFVVLGIVY